MEAIALPAMLEPLDRQYQSAMRWHLVDTHSVGQTIKPQESHQTGMKDGIVYMHLYNEQIIQAVLSSWIIWQKHYSKQKHLNLQVAMISLCKLNKLLLIVCMWNKTANSQVSIFQWFLA